MKTGGWIVAYVSLALAGVGTPPSGGAESTTGIDAILAKWERTSRNCRTFDAKFTRFNYDHVRGLGGRSQQGRSQQGRFYFEAPDKARYEIGQESATRSDEGVYVWSVDKLLIIDPSAKTYRELSISELEQARMRFRQRATAPRDHLSWYELFFSWTDQFAAAMFVLSRPDEALPLVVNIDAASLRKRLDFTTEQVDMSPWLTAVPKPHDDRLRFKKIQVILDPESYRTMATQVVHASGHSRVVHVFEDVKINEPPKDRDLLLRPDLSGLQRLY